MEKKFKHKEKRGLPGGPNEYITHVSGTFSMEGYKRNSPDINNPHNIIPSGNITMQDVDFPVYGIDNLGNEQIMKPGNDYEFPGDMVFETPMYKNGGSLLTKTMKCKNCSWSWKASDGGKDVDICHKCGSEALSTAQAGNGEYKVKSGDTFYGIANRNKLDWNELKKLNPNIDINDLKLNQSIILPEVNKSSTTLKAFKPEETSWSDYINPMNWGVTDRDDDGEFKEAFRASRAAEEDEFMWRGTRYSTELKPEVKKLKEVKSLTETLPEKKINQSGITSDILLKQMWTESKFNPKAGSSAGARGLAQITPITEKELKRLKLVDDDFDVYNEEDAIKGQKVYMDYLYNRPWINKENQTDEVRLAKTLAAYNRGPNAVEKILTKQKEKGVDIYNSLDWTSALPEETKDYIDYILLGNNTERRPHFQKNYSKAISNENNKKYLDLYKFQYAGETKKYYPIEDRIMVQDNTRVVMPYNKYMDKTFKVNKLEAEIFQKDKEVTSRQYESPDLNFGKKLALEKIKNEKNKELELNQKEIEDLNLKDKKEISEIQSNLIQKGYDLGEYGVDGIAGSKTKTAYANNMLDSNLDLSSIDRYYKKYSDKNADVVSNIQKKLVDNNLLKQSEIDGKFGPKTKSALEVYNNKGNEDLKGNLFESLPNELSETRCAAGLCTMYEANSIDTQALGIKYKNAWDMLENMKKKGNSSVVYNIYDDERFKNISSDSDLKNTTKQIKKENVTNKSMYEIGDVVGLYWDGSDHHAETLNSTTHNTHVGFVSNIKNGIPIISHNVNGKVLHQPYSKLTTTWISRPDDSALETASQVKELKFDDSDYKNFNENTDYIIDNYEVKKERPLTDNEKTKVNNVAKRVFYSSDKIKKTLDSELSSDWLRGAVLGITGVESGVGLNTDVGTLREIGYTLKGKSEESKSKGVGKIKYNSIDPFAKNYFNIKSPEDLNNPDKNVDLITYMLIKSYEIFKDYSEQFPELNLNEEDLKNMAILAHNQGVSGLLYTGRSKKPQNEAVMYSEEVDNLRHLYQGKIKDVTSTNYNHFGALGKAAYDRLEDGDETYISKVNRYANEVVNNKPQNKAMAIRKNGGEFNKFETYKNYVKGNYKNTPEEKFGKQIYDKLNRVYYKQAKNANTTVPNYIMTQIIRQTA